MKLTKLLLLAFMGMTLLMGCGGDDEESPVKQDPEGDCFTATVGSEEYVGETITSVDNTAFLSITSVAGGLDPKTFTITIGGDNGFLPGTYSIDTLNTDNDIFVGIYTQGLLLTTYTSKTGTLIVEEVDTDNQKVKGTFEFEAETSQGEMLSITNGVFDVSY